MDMSKVFFPWKNPKFPLGDVAFWIVAILTAVFAIPALVLGPEVAFAAVGIGAFAAAGVQQVFATLEPEYVQ